MAAKTYRLKLADGVVYAERGGKHLFLQPAAPDWMVVNLNGAILLSRCDGAPMEEVLGEREEAMWEQSTMLFAEALGRAILVDAAAGQVTTGRERQGSAPQPLRVVHLKLTNRCNLRCTYCYAESGGNQGTRGELMREDLSSIAESVRGMGAAVEYVVSGGEPLLHPDALWFMERVKAEGNAVHLLTNGTLIDESNAERIARATDLVKISMDGSSEAAHAVTRGAGNFARVEKAIALLEQHGARVVVAMTVTRENRGEIGAMVAKYGTKLSLQPLFQAGRAAGGGSSMENTPLSGEEYYRALTAVKGVAPMGAMARRLKMLRGRGVRRCAMAEREISIAETGDVYPCQLLHGDEFRAGNVREQTVAEIYAMSPVMERLREVSVETLAKCSECAVRLLCGGACRARDLAETGSIEEVGEFCAYEREALLQGLFDSVELELA
ncbi:MAG: radical SAM protein [Acidobacteriaceae bacterium]